MLWCFIGFNIKGVTLLRHLCDLKIVLMSIKDMHMWSSFKLLFRFITIVFGLNCSVKYASFMPMEQLCLRDECLKNIIHD